MKPDAKIYEALEKMAGKRGAEILYLDDRIENAQAGVVRGWEAVHHRNVADSTTAVTKAGLLPDK